MLILLLMMDQLIGLTSEIGLLVFKLKYWDQFSLADILFMKT